MRKVFGGRGVATETKSASAACDMCSAPVAKETTWILKKLKKACA